MKRWLAGGAALGLAAVGTMVFAGPSSAQDAPLEATIEPTSVPQGGTVTLSSIDPCLDPEGVPGTVVIEIFFEDELEPFQTDEFDLTPEENPDGQWAFDYTGAPDEPVGTYTYLVTCFDDQDNLINEYVPLAAETVAAPTPTTAPPAEPPAPAPAPPVTRTPSFTG